MPGLDAAQIRARLASARLYLCTGLRPDLPEFVDAALRGGVDIVQLREKGLEAGPELAALEPIAELCAAHGALLAVTGSRIGSSTCPMRSSCGIPMPPCGKSWRTAASRGISARMTRWEARRWSMEPRAG